MTARRLAVFIVAAFMAAPPAAAQEVGTATAVNPTSESTRPGSATITTLTVGARIVHKERIHTTPSGTVQLLFNDKSTLSIAPNTSIVIDEYVYNPNSNSGHMLTTLTQGALRFVGGALSHQGQASINTSDAAIGIRGGTVTIIQGSDGTKVIDHYGVVTIQNGAGTMTISRSGFFVLINGWNSPPSQPQPVTEQEIAYYLKLLTSKPGQNGGVPGLTTVTINPCGIVGPQPSYNCASTPWIPNDAGQNAWQTILQGTQHGTGTIAPPNRRSP
jgi:hypothetical protein